MNSLKHWFVERDASNVVWLGLDRFEQAVNSLSVEVLDELAQILDDLDKKQGGDVPRGLIIYSKKESGFIAGADVTTFADLKDTAAAEKLLVRGQEVFAKLANTTYPTVAMVKGYCLGGGLELSLACRYIVACNDDKTRLGLPEVRLGIQPGWGGSVRLLRRTGALKGFDLILTGRMLRARAAKKIHLVDAAVPERQLRRAALGIIEKQPQAKALPWYEKLLNVKPMRELFANIMRRKVKRKAKETHYPAPFKMIDNWERYGIFDEKAFRAEIDGILELITTNKTAQNLLRVFFLQERLKGLAKVSAFTPKHVHVIGAGTMGGDIAAWCALRGLKVTLQDQSINRIAPAVKRAHKLYKKKLKKPHLIQAAMDRLTPDVEGVGVRSADVIIEAIFEDLKVKQSVFATIEKQAKPDAILATNTSSIPLDNINKALSAPERLVGIHFFNPVAQMPLVEVVIGEKTDAKIANDAIAFVGQIDRLPLPVKSAPGFLVNRVLVPYLMEAMQMLEEGVPPSVIDDAALDFGMPMGPIELADTVGLDVCTTVAEHLLGEQAIPQRLQLMIERKQLGRKTNQGFYEYNKQGKVRKPKVSSNGYDTQALADRMIGKMTDEAKQCLAEHLVEDADLIDAGMIFGTGFAPFRGGPLTYVEQEKSK